MTSTVQQLRTQAEQGIANDVQAANTAMQQIAQINTQLQSTTSDGAKATLQDQRDQDITQLAKLMDIRVVQNSNSQVSVFTGDGQQLVGAQAAQLVFSNAGTLNATSLWNADPSKDGAGTISLVSPGGATSDLVADNSIQSGELAAYLKMRDTILPQAQNQLDQLANQMSQASSNQTTAGTAVSSGSQSGYGVDIGSLSPGNSFQVTYTDAANQQHTVTVVALGQGGQLPPPQPGANPNNQTVGINLSGGMASIVSQLNTALGSTLQFSNPSGTTLQVLNSNGTANVVNSLSATSTVTSLTSGG